MRTRRRFRHPPIDEDCILLINRLAARNHQEGTGGPFAALVVEAETGRIRSAGVDMVLAFGLSSAHAEVVALSLAQAGPGSWDLDAPVGPALELVVNRRTCVMRYSAATWSGVRRLFMTAHGPEVEDLTGLDEGPMREDSHAHGRR
ncbi:hypothetical protein ABT300_10835 [Streptomyces sp. NPDC001027]|uniref:hypothetical protein n=1 Tax=Streptomyces sp. NPDC001027 TaxID=3154771 RepID=UPI003324AC9B